jgi:histidinol-phosphatase (PHP family)
MSASAERVSIHGGHSGEFCGHAEDTLADIVAAYCAKGYTWVGITEHMPPVNDHYRYAEERAAGLDAGQLMERFAYYVDAARQLQRAHADELTLFVAMEFEAHPGSIDLAKTLLAEHGLDYVVGSIHHVDTVPIDTSQADYARAAAAAGGITPLYCRYFDAQYEMLTTLTPAAVGHFDRIRTFDDGYPDRIVQPEVWQRVVRNLKYIRDRDLILDINLRALLHGDADPYPCRPILRQVAEMGIKVAPGDDSHGVASVGACWEAGMAALEAAGVPLVWARPV